MIRSNLVMKFTAISGDADALSARRTTSGASASACSEAGNAQFGEEV
jgi:hypothetical protein